MDYWRIWFEVFEDDRKIGSGVWYYPYKNKSSAVRRAKQMWSEDLYNPLTGTTISRKWIVSKTNPWERKSFHEACYFKTEEDAKNVISGLVKLCQWYGVATRADFLDLVNARSSGVDANHGWMGNAIKTAKIVPVDNGYFLEMPMAVSLV